MSSLSSRRFQTSLPKTNLYWLASTVMMFLLFVLLGVSQSLRKDASLTAVFHSLSQFAPSLFLWLLSMVGTAGLVIGGGKDAQDRGGSGWHSGGLGCLGAVLVFLATSDMGGEQYLLPGFYIMLGCCFGLEIAAIREPEPVPATPVVPLAVVALASVLVGHDAAAFLPALFLLLVHQGFFGLLRHLKRQRSTRETDVF